MLGFSVWSPKGGVGKTTAAVNLASAFSEKSFRVLVCDTDYHDIGGVRYGQRSAFNFHKAGNVPWNCMVGLPQEVKSSDYDVVIVDCKPGYEKPLTDTVLVPQVLSKIDIDAYNESSELLTGVGRVLRFASLYDLRNSTHREAIIDFKKISPLAMKNRHIYQRAMNQGKTIFEVSKNTYGVREARKEINVIAEALLNEK